MSIKNKIMIAGAVIGLISVALVYFGNPANMGFCIACFLRDTAGGLGLHRSETVQYIRPELAGLILGALIISQVNKEFLPKGGSSPFTRFIIAFFIMIGALMFLGCPFRMILRLAGGDFNALLGLLGFAFGIGAGIFFLNRGFTLRRSYRLSTAEGLAMPIVFLSFLLLLLIPSLLYFSTNGPGSNHAPFWISLIAGLIVGILAQRTRFCMVGGIRDFILFKEPSLLLGFLTFFMAALTCNLLLGFFHPGFVGQPIAHTDGLWNALGMALVGFGSVLLGGCPLRQLVLAGEGNTDSAITVLGLLTGAAFCHNFNLASSPDGPTFNGQVAVILGFVVLTAIAVFNSTQSAIARR